MKKKMRRKYSSKYNDYCREILAMKIFRYSDSEIAKILKERYGLSCSAAGIATYCRKHNICKAIKSVKADLIRENIVDPKKDSRITSGTNPIKRKPGRQKKSEYVQDSILNLNELDDKSLDEYLKKSNSDLNIPKNIVNQIKLFKEDT